MRIEICQSYEALSLKAKEIVTSELGQHKALTLCAATGGSPTRMYELLVEEASRQPELFSQFTVLKLDEWGGIPMDHPGTCESYLRNYFVGPLQIPEDRYIAFQSDPENPKAECERIQQILEYAYSYRHLYIRNRDERSYRLERAGSFLTYELPCGSSVPEILATSHDRRGYGETGIRTDIGHGEYLSVTPDYPSYQRDKEKGDYSSFP